MVMGERLDCHEAFALECLQRLTVPGRATERYAMA